MGKSYANRVIMVLAIVALVGTSSIAFAGWGRGDCPGYGPGRGYGQGAGDGRGPQLSEDDAGKLAEERDRFRKETSELRRQLYAKDLALQSVLAEKSVDVKKAKAIRKELSDLEAQFAQKRLEHRIRVREIFPEAGLRTMGGGKRFRQPGGGYGPGSCWR